MTENMYLNSRPVAVGATAAVLDRFLMGEQDMMKNAYFGVAVGAGVYAGEMLAPHVYNFPSLNQQLYSGKTLGTRIAEVSIGGVLGFGVNRYVLRNDLTIGQATSRLGTIVLADVLGTYLMEYFDDKPLDYLNE